MSEGNVLSPSGTTFYFSSICPAISFQTNSFQYAPATFLTSLTYNAVNPDLESEAPSIFTVSAACSEGGVPPAFESDCPPCGLQGCIPVPIFVYFHYDQTGKLATAPGCLTLFYGEHEGSPKLEPIIAVQLESMAVPRVLAPSDVCAVIFCDRRSRDLYREALPPRIGGTFVEDMSYGRHVFPYPFDLYHGQPISASKYQAVWHEILREVQIMIAKGVWKLVQDRGRVGQLDLPT